MHVMVEQGHILHLSCFQADLIQAAQEERVHRLKLKRASKQQAAHAAEALFQAPSGLAAFTNKLLQVCARWFGA